MVFPLAIRTALVGSGLGLLVGSVFVKYSDTIAAGVVVVTSTMRALPESVMRVLPLGSRLAKAANDIPALYYHTMFPALLISITRLLFSSAIRTLLLGSTSALLGLFSAP